MEHLDDQEQERSIHVMDYYYILLKHKWLILAALGIDKHVDDLLHVHDGACLSGHLHHDHRKGKDHLAVDG